MKGIGAALRGEVRHCRLAAGVLRTHRAGLQLEFTDGLRRRAEFVVRAAGEIHSSNRDAIDQNLVGILLAAVDRALPGTARRARQRRKDKLLDLAPAVAYRDRPRIELLLRYIAANLRGTRLNEWRIAGYRDTISSATHLQREIHRQCLCDR
jgi:hypothetical protein